MTLALGLEASGVPPLCLRVMADGFDWFAKAGGVSQPPNCLSFGVADSKLSVLVVFYKFVGFGADKLVKFGVANTALI